MTSSHSEGTYVINVGVPSKEDAVEMLLSIAGIENGDVLQQRHKEIGQIADICNRLPLTIGVAGKLIRQVARGQGSNIAANDWADVRSMLKEELDGADGASIEESVIRASIKAIPRKVRAQVMTLFNSFALAPEDMVVPLPILGLIFNATANASSSSSARNNPATRLQVRQYLKILIDRSLMLGTVDRPQLHDVMLEYVKKELTGEKYKEAQRELVEGLRKTDRSPSSPTGKYMALTMKHHMQEAFNGDWESCPPQAISWLDDHVRGVQDVVSFSAALFLPVEALANQAEAGGNARRPLPARVCSSALAGLPSEPLQCIQPPHPSPPPAHQRPLAPPPTLSSSVVLTSAHQRRRSFPGRGKVVASFAPVERFCCVQISGRHGRWWARILETFRRYRIKDNRHCRLRWHRPLVRQQFHFCVAVRARYAQIDCNVDFT